VCTGNDMLNLERRDGAMRFWKPAVFATEAGATPDGPARIDVRPRSCPNGKACLSQYATCTNYAARQPRGDGHGAYNPLHAA
jgi:hypothetical protein